MTQDYPSRYASECATLDEFGEDRVLEMIACGITQRRIAAAAGVNQARLSIWLASEVNRSARAKAAMATAAEAWADNGLDAIESARGNPALAGWARVMDQHCRWRAATHNPQYRDKADIDISGQVQHVQAIRRVVIDTLPMVEQVQQQLEHSTGMATGTVLGPAPSSDSAQD